MQFRELTYRERALRERVTTKRYGATQHLVHVRVVREERGPVVRGVYRPYDGPRYAGPPVFPFGYAESPAARTAAARA